MDSGACFEMLSLAKAFYKIGLRLVAQLVATLAVGRPGWGTLQFKIFSQGIGDHGTDQPPPQPAFFELPDPSCISSSCFGQHGAGLWDGDDYDWIEQGIATKPAGGEWG